MPPTTRSTTIESDDRAGDQRRILEKIFAEGKANEELSRTDPDAYKRKMEAELPVNKCCFRGHGNNPWPVLPYREDTGVACDGCDFAIVLKQRLREADRSAW